MAVNIIRGAIGTGKGEACIEQIREIHRKYPSDRCIMLVPNHYSYEAERKFVEVFGGTGLNNIDVWTPRKMALSLLDRESLNHITASGRQMLIYCAIEEFIENNDIKMGTLLAAIKKQGFVEVMSSLISEFKRYGVLPEALRSSADKVSDNETLENKLKAISRIYEGYLELIGKSQYVDMEDDNDRVAEKISMGDEFDSHTHIWIDKFDEINPQQMRVFYALAKKGADITFCVNFPKNVIGIYSYMQGAMARLEEMTADFGLGKELYTGTEFKTKKSEDIDFLLQNWNSVDTVYEKESESIFFSEQRDIYSEAEQAAAAISDLVREQNFRYGDIAIICGDTESYLHIIETVFDEYRIPYFADSSITLSDHPIAMQILSVFDILEKNWQYDSVFAYLKSGFIYTRSNTGISPLRSEEVDYLENYVLKYGIIGEKRWTAEWEDGEEILDAAFDRKSDTDADLTADNMRRTVTEPIIALKEKTNKPLTAREHSRALFEFLGDINLFGGLKTEIAEMRNKGQVNEAEQFTKIWNLLLDVLNQAAVAGGDRKISFQQFGNLIRVGLTKCRIRTIPSGIDRVYIGDADKGSAREVRAMFILGTVDGTFPSGIATEGFFSDNDRNTLEENCGIRLAPNTKRKFAQQYFKVYRTICSVTERLYISYPIQSAEGKSIMPSHLISDILRVVPHIRRNGKADGLYISTPEATIHRLLINKSHMNKNRDPLWEAVYEWYSGRPEWKSLLSLINRAKWYDRGEIKLDRELAEQLYEKRVMYSASRLNSFSLCPYGYFLKYGMRLKEREVWEMSAAEVGSYAHEIIKAFCGEVEGDAENAAEKLKRWRELEDERRDEIIDALVEQTCENMSRLSKRDRGKNVGILRRTGRNIKNAAKTVHMSLSKGEYAECGMEAAFKIPINPEVGIKGIIDRVDMYDDGEDIRVRIVDYKTGSTSFDVKNIVNGVDMQMVIYAIAAREMANEERARISGIYYNKMHSDFENLSIGGEANYEKGVMRLDGVTFVRSDEDLRAEDADIEKTQKSGFLNIEYYKNGNLKNKNAVHDAFEIEGLMETVKENIENTDGKIKSGEISCTPYEKNGLSNACTFCRYGEVCSFCGAKTARVIKGNDEEIWKEMREKGIAIKEKEVSIRKKEASSKEKTASIKNKTKKTDEKETGEHNESAAEVKDELDK